MRLRLTLRRLSQRSWRDRLALLRAAGLLLVIRAALSILPFRRAVEWVERLAGVGRPNRAPRVHPQRMIWAVEAAGRRLFPGKPCLPQALAVLYLLRRRSIPAELRIGVAREADHEAKPALRAHAWVDSEGSTVIGDRPSGTDYTAFPSLGLQQSHLSDERPGS